MIKNILSGGYQWRSKTEFLGWPLVHIAFGRERETGKFLIARGIIAVGQFAVGVIAVGQFAIGLAFALAQFAVGTFAVAQFALGLVFGLGQFATGIVAIGQFSASCFADNTFSTMAAPPFKIISGNREALTSDDIKGKIAVFFYETKGTIEQNRKLKDSLNSFYAAQPQEIRKDILRAGVIDCRGVLFRGVWEKALRDNSAKEGLTLYGDWDGKMCADYRLRQGQSNIIIIDKQGYIRYYASGRLGDKQAGEIQELLKKLIRGEK